MSLSFLMSSDMSLLNFIKVVFVCVSLCHIVFEFKQLFFLNMFAKLFELFELLWSDFYYVNFEVVFILCEEAKFCEHLSYLYL